MNKPPFDYQFRLIVIGDSGVGKTALLQQFTNGKMPEVSDPTIGVDFSSKTIQLDNGKEIKLQLWDTAGQEKFRSITTAYYKNSVGALIVYDICNKFSFEHVPFWIEEAKKHMRKPMFVLVGCKMDKVSSSSREVTPSEAEALAKKYKILHHFETSAKYGLNVEHVFKVMAEEVYKCVERGDYPKTEDWEGVRAGYRIDEVDLNILEGEPAKTSCCWKGS